MCRAIRSYVDFVLYPWDDHEGLFRVSPLLARQSGLALVQCQIRGIEPGPINTFPKWQDLRRHVKRGEKALTLCMPVTVKRKETDETGKEQDASLTTFVYKARWFVLAQTDGEAMELPEMPAWDAGRCMSALDIERVAFIATEPTDKARQ